ncbi:hypothetical protein COW36_24530 [bacterium (Candidatus Blackallbacteria) CG17_big_fil_post_rev_8_21_14_2_50_48_46]|uniref:Uncharacterized protein n=1 Tax=bacterium (Candidatus Blackallbacteria) CG17_big_fil_post_rev_8_21_14_2_50_48_46 TaxID=2014261 RepID=A0A2M7FYJ8_9BACT|nr:MAG: hypothetical protein COW64_19470 [bacterium (Candidatus Blackallbacteria) CG18_big_fil_WC_8_21_14_2_50_49_26]PIW13836.1 MAG: hypothetical protein COW36_24530 [bacterium (Candidatus Blackallbacteria) CG17_big_fil_post_rev_8_21_14_2_50_48_46]PIW45062.1 MAG: hypothetical protein COW20_22160 [bacterium (Candidatus Blackallbacteria) CG13_big_fil_rev_8_21_14_2_50_49_14]
MSFILLLLYLLEVGVEGYMFRIVLEGCKDRPVKEVFVDIFAVNMVTLVLVVLVLGRVLVGLDFNMAMVSSFRTAMIVLPQTLVKVSLFTILADAIVLPLYLHIRYPGRYDPVDTAFKAGIMNMPAMLIAAVLWIFTELINEFLLWIRL